MCGKTDRIWELDLLRGLALILMIYFHIIYDLKEIFNYPVVYESGVNYYIGKAAGVLFIFAAGTSSLLSLSNPLRALRILAIAVAITIITHLYNINLGIKFGILHFLGVSILTVPVAQRINKYFLFVLGAVIIAVTPDLLAIPVNHNMYFPVGLTTSDFISSDYYPLLPWYGVFLFGLGAGKIFYREKVSIFSFRPQDTIINRIGRRTLLIYLVHQPVIMLILAIYTYIKAAI